MIVAFPKNLSKGLAEKNEEIKHSCSESLDNVF